MRTRLTMILASVFVAVGLGVGLGVGLSGSGNSENTSSVEPAQLASIRTACQQWLKTTTATGRR